jgi:glycosyltransferase involved in cell wall biosynthesis
MNWDLAWAAKKDKVDILFCPDYRAPIFYRGKTAITLHDISYEANPKSFNWKSPADKILLKWASKKTAKKAAVIFTPSEFSRQEVIKYYKISPEKVLVTFLAPDNNLRVDNQGSSPAENFKKISEKFGISNNFIFYVGSIFTRRHLAVILDAFKKLAAERADYQILLAGRDYTDGGLINKKTEEINKVLGKQAILRVDFLDDLELKLLYSACAFFIWLSDYEGFGLPVLEAMSLGTPVITSEAASLKEIAGQAALLIKNNEDSEEIYQAMKDLAGDDSLRQKLAEKGKEQAAKFSWGKCAEETFKALILLK